jgi:hypothetical protein
VEVRGEMKEDRFGILLSAFDSVLGEALGQKIVIRLAGTDLQPPEDPGLEAPSPPAGTIEAPTIKVSPLPNTTIVQSAVIPVEGTVTDTAGFKDFYVKVNNKKVYYRSAADNPKEMKFKVNVPLKDGMNVLYLVARKDDELMAVDKYIITRPAGPNTAEN